MRMMRDGSVLLTEGEARIVARVLELGHKLAEMSGGYEEPDEDTVEAELVATIDLLAVDHEVTPHTLRNSIPPPSGSVPTDPSTA